MSDPVKFTFDQAFDGGAKSRYEEDIETLRQQAEEARMRAYEEGAAAGHARAHQEIEAAMAQTLERVFDAAGRLFQGRAELEARLDTQMAELALAMARRLARSLLDKYAVEDVERLARDILATVKRDSRLALTVSEALAGPLKERLDALKTETRFSGAIDVRGDADFAFGDCHLEWDDGGVERRQADVEKEIETLVHRFVNGGGTAGDTAVEQKDTAA